MDPVDAAKDALVAVASKATSDGLRHIGSRTVEWAKAKLLDDWRTNNVAETIATAQEMARELDEDLSQPVHPSVMVSIVEEASWNDDEELRSAWAGLMLASVGDGRDVSSRTFLHLVRQLTPSQAKLLWFACRNVPKGRNPKSGLIVPGRIEVSVDRLKAVTCVESVHQLDMDIDSLLQLGLLLFSVAGIRATHDELTHVDVTPTAIALHLYARCHGRKNIVSCFGTDHPPVSYEQLTPLRID